MRATPAPERSGNDGNHGEHEQPPERKRLSLAAARSVPRVPTQQVLATRHRVQVRTPPGHRRSAEWKSHRVLR